MRIDSSYKKLFVGTFDIYAKSSEKSFRKKKKRIFQVRNLIKNLTMCIKSWLRVTQPRSQGFFFSGEKPWERVCA